MKITGHLLLLALGSACLPLLSVGQSSTTPEPPKEVKSFDASIVDKSVDPCTDFYQYACGNWIKQNPVPSDQVVWARSFSLLDLRNRYLLWKELESAAKDPATPLQKKYGDYYAACMNTDLIESKGLAPLSLAFEQIAAFADPKQLATLLGKLQDAGNPASLFGFGVTQDDVDSSKQIAVVMQGGLSLPDRDYYLKDSLQKIREQYLAHVIKMFTLAGDSPEAAQKEAAAVVRIETALAKGATSRTDLRDPKNRYHIYTVQKLVELSPGFEWPVYWKALPVGHFDTLNVATPEFFKALNQLIETEPAEAWRAYFRWRVLTGSAANLPKAFFDEDFAFFGKTLSGQKEPTPRWRQCTTATDRALGEAVGQDWVKENFPPAAKASMDKLVAALEKALGEDLQTLPWMSDATKKEAEAKLNLIRNKIGYPEKWRDYTALEVKRDDLLGNVQRATVFRRNYGLAKLGQPVNEKEWGMSPPTVNAYYNPSMNDINFPAGILQPPFFDFTVDPAVNFGGIGMVIGHEMTHGFDDEGSKYDGKGNLREWQTAEDRKKFTERTDCEVAEYNGFDASPAHDDLPEVKLNGKLTLGENTADNGGLRIAYIALLDTLAEQGKSIDDKIDGYTEAQRYFLGFAQVWCENVTDAAARQGALTDPHSPGRWRVNGTVQNFDAFGKAFGCKQGQPMVPVNSCRVW